MAFRKFGQSDDQRVSVEEDEQKSFAKEASRKTEWTEEDRRELQAESEN